MDDKAPSITRSWELRDLGGRPDWESLAWNPAQKLPALGPTDVLVKFRAAPLNFRDLVSRWYIFKLDFFILQLTDEQYSRQRVVYTSPGGWHCSQRRRCRRGHRNRETCRAFSPRRQSPFLYLTDRILWRHAPWPWSCNGRCRSCT